MLPGGENENKKGKEEKELKSGTAKVNKGLRCQVPEHNNEDTSIICLKPICVQNRLICMKCCLKEHAKHPFIFLNDFMTECKHNITNVVEMLPKSLKLIEMLEADQVKLIETFRGSINNYIDRILLARSHEYYQKLRYIFNTRADLDAISTALEAISYSNTSTTKEINDNLNFLFNSLKLNDFFSSAAAKNAVPASIFHFDFEQGFKSLLDQGSLLNKELEFLLNKNFMSLKLQTDQTYQKHMQSCNNEDFDNNNIQKFNFKISEPKRREEIAVGNQRLSSFCHLGAIKNMNLIAACGSEADINIYDINNKIAIFQSLRGHKAKVNKLLYRPESQILISSSDDCSIKVWDLTTWECTQTLKKHDEAVLGLSSLSDSHFFASCSSDKTIKIWNLETLSISQVFKIETTPTEILMMALIDRKFNIVIGDKSGWLYWVDSSEEKVGEVKKRSKAFDNSISFLCHIKGKNQVVCAAHEKSIKIFCSQAKELVKELSLSESNNIYSVSYNYSNDFIIFTSSDSFLRVLRLSDYKVLAEAKEEEPCVIDCVEWVQEKKCFVMSINSDLSLPKEGLKNNNTRIKLKFY